MLTQSFLRRGSPLLVSSTARPMQAALFSSGATEQKDRHKSAHYANLIHPKFYENDFVSTSIRELEYVRSPFYELGMQEHMKEGKDAHDFI